MSDEAKIDEYELVNCIATGNATQIWEVRQGGQAFAMKLLLDEAFKDPEQKKSLKAEANLGKTFEHPHIIKIFQLVMNKKHGYFIMEHFRGNNMKSMIRHEHFVVQSKAQKVCEAMTQALGLIHEKGWVHRDVKPENILLNKSGEIRLIDFNLTSRPTSLIARALTKKKNIVIQGTRTYLAPELIKREPLTPLADIYSLGIVMFESMVGFPPFRHGNPNELLMMHVRELVPNPSEFDDNITPEADKFIQRMLAKKPKDRPQSMQEVFSELRSIRFFKEDPIALGKARAEALKASDAQASEDRLNSRRDAERTAQGIAAPKRPEKKKVPPPKKLEAKRGATPATTQPPPQKIPGYPGFPMPGMQYPPGYPMPGMPMPGYPMPGGGFPNQMGMPAFGQGGMPQFPGMPMPGMPMPGAPVPGMPHPGGAAQGPPPGQPVPGGAPGMPTNQPPPSGAGQRPQPEPPKPTAAEPAPKPKEEIPLATLDDLEIEFE